MSKYKTAFYSLSTYFVSISMVNRTKCSNKTVNQAVCLLCPITYNITYFFLSLFHYLFSSPTFSYFPGLFNLIFPGVFLGLPCSCVEIYYINISLRMSHDLIQEEQPQILSFCLSSCSRLMLSPNLKTIPFPAFSETF